MAMRRTRMTAHLSRKNVLALLAAAAGTVRPHRLLAQSVPIRIGATTSDAGAGPLYALDGGFFSKANLKVEMTVFTQTSGQVIDAIAGGSLDVGIADPIQVGNAFNRDVPFGFFAAGAEYSTDAPTTLFCVGKTGQVKSAKDLEGQTVAVNGFGSIQELSLREWIHSNGADLANVKFTEIPPAAIAVALERGTVAGAMISEPFLSAAADRVTRLASAFDACARHFYINAWFGNRDWLAKNAETARRLRRAVYDSGRWANQHHDLTVPILAKYLKLEPGTILHMTRAGFGTSLDLGKIQPVLDLAWRYKVLKKELTATQLVAPI
jgi:NitT/TauT family transport system substrate-binding protein